MVKYLGVYRRTDGWYIHSTVETTKGVLLTVPPFVKLPLDERSQILGEKVQRVLAIDHGIVPHPKVFEGIFQSMLNLAKVKSWSQFMKGVPSIGISDDGIQLSFEPYANKGPRGAYRPLVEKYFQINRDSTPVEIAAAVERAIALCE